MPTDLKKPVTRRSKETIRERSKAKRIIVTIYPAGFIGLRLEKNRTEETIPIAAAWSLAVKMRVASQRAQKLAKRKQGK